MVTNKLGRPKRVTLTWNNAGTYRITENAWSGLRKLAMRYGYMYNIPGARGITTFLQALAYSEAKFCDNRPDYMRELDPVAKASLNATVWHDASDLAVPRRIANLPLGYLAGLCQDHGICSRAKQATVARGLDLHRPRAYAPSNTRALVSAALEAIGMEYLALTPEAAYRLRPLTPEKPRRLENSTKLVG